MLKYSYLDFGKEIKISSFVYRHHYPIYKSKFFLSDHLTFSFSVNGQKAFISKFTNKHTGLGK